MLRTVLMLPFLFLASAALAAPVLITSSTGTVSLIQNGSTSLAPGVPFLVPPGSTLQLDSDAEIVVMTEGTAKRWTGPATLGERALIPNTTGPERGGSQLAALLSRQDTLSAPGATRDGVLQRPIHRDTLLTLQEVRWHCADPCSPENIKVQGLISGTSWTSTGTGSVRYSGPELAAGPYTLDVGGRVYTFTIADDLTRSTVNTARSEARTQASALEGASKAEQAALVAGVMFALGYPTEGLAELDRAGQDAAELLRRYEAFAHLHGASGK